MNLTSYSEIQEILRRNGFSFSKSLGQNFLIDASVPERIAQASMCEGKTVLEIGPGVGCLTRELSNIAHKVNSVELDKTLMPILSETLSGCENVEVYFRDALKDELPEADVVCANLPYNITSPMLTKLVNCGYEYITVMIQREVAKRICADAGDKDYSAFGLFVQWSYEAEILFDVSPNCFVPQPKVTSSVIRLCKRQDHPAKVDNEEFMFKLIRSSFNQRRKTLVNAISNVCMIDKETARQALNNCGLDINVRGEVLSIEDFARLSDELIRII